MEFQKKIPTTNVIAIGDLLVKRQGQYPCLSLGRFKLTQAKACGYQKGISYTINLYEEEKSEG